MRKLSLAARNALIGGALIACCIVATSIGFSAWSIGEKQPDPSASISTEIGKVETFANVFAYFGLEANETLTPSSLSYYSVTKTANFDETNPTEIAEADQTTNYYFDTDYISVIMDVDRANDNFNSVPYDDTTLSYIAVDVDIYKHDEEKHTTPPDLTLSALPTNTISYMNVSDPTGVTVTPTFFTVLEDNDGGRNYTEITSTTSITSNTEIHAKLTFDSDRYRVAHVYHYSINEDLTIASRKEISLNVFGYYVFKKTANYDVITIAWGDMYGGVEVDGGKTMSSYLSGATVRPYNLPNYEFDMIRTTNSSLPNRFYFGLKMSNVMSLYSLFTYDHSYETIALTDSSGNTNKRTIPIEFCFNFNETALNSLLANYSDFLTGSYYFRVDFTILSTEEYQTLEGGA